MPLTEIVIHKYDWPATPVCSLPQCINFFRDFQRAWKESFRSGKVELTDHVHDEQGNPVARLVAKRSFGRIIISVGGGHGASSNPRGDGAAQAR